MDSGGPKEGEKGIISRVKYAILYYLGKLNTLEVYSSGSGAKSLHFRKDLWNSFFGPDPVKFAHGAIYEGSDILDMAQHGFFQAGRKYFIIVSDETVQRTKAETEIKS